MKLMSGIYRINELGLGLGLGTKSNPRDNEWELRIQFGIEPIHGLPTMRSQLYIYKYAFLINCTTSVILNHMIQINPTDYI